MHWLNSRNCQLAIVLANIEFKGSNRKFYADSIFKHKKNSIDSTSGYIFLTEMQYNRFPPMVHPRMTSWLRFLSSQNINYRMENVTENTKTVRIFLMRGSKEQRLKVFYNRIFCDSSLSKR